MMSLWGKDFEIVDTKAKTKSLVKKAQSPKSIKVEKASSKEGASLPIRLANIEKEVNRILGIYKERTTVLKSYDDYKTYIDKAIANGVIAVDTETNNSLDPITCDIMGLCLYTPGQKNAYIPVNHTDLEGNRLDWQLTESQIKQELERLKEVKTKTIWHNAKFDYEVLKCTCDFTADIYWDTLIASRILNENEKAGLKVQYINKIDPSIEKYDIEHLFEKVPYNFVSPDLFALYAATDAFMTYELYLYQLKMFNKPQNIGLDNIFNIEMQVIIPTAEMELTGVCIDTEFAKSLSEKWHRKEEEANKVLNAELEKLIPKVTEWRQTKEANYKPPKKNKDGFGKSKNEQLTDPINLLSPTQLAILLYDVLKVPVVDQKSPRGTGEDILMKIDLPLCTAILNQRSIQKLLSTYIDKIPECISPKDHRLHTNFKQIGADTGRFSSDSPNIQNIPASEKSIRMMFMASPNYVMVGSDYSQQEPRILATMSDDDAMLSAYAQGKDLYATIATKIYHNNYWDNMEFHEKEKIHPNPEGKKRRSKCKSVLLGLMYGRGANSIAEQMGVTKEEAQEIIANFYAGFPKVKQWMDQSQEDCRNNGYVTDLWGRRRRLPDIQLPKYQVSYIDDNKTPDFNPLIINAPISTKIHSENDLIKKFESFLLNAKSRKDVADIKAKATASGLKVKDNGAFISQAERQCVNARIQGGAATLTKLAMIAVHNDKELKSLGFRLLIPVHDELIGECPHENANKVAERLTSIMIDVAKKDVKCPMKCDADISPCWYYTDYGDMLREEFEEMITEGISEKDALIKLQQEHCECTLSQIDKFIHK